MNIYIWNVRALGMFEPGQIVSVGRTAEEARQNIRERRPMIYTGPPEYEWIQIDGRYMRSVLKDIEKDPIMLFGHGVAIGFQNESGIEG